MSRERMTESLFALLGGTLYVWALSWGILSATILPFSPVSLLGLCAVSVCGMVAVCYNRYTVLAALGVLGLLAVFATASYFRQGIAADWLEGLQAFAVELGEFARDERAYREGYMTPIAGGITVLLALLAVMNLRGHFGFWLLALTGFGVFFLPVTREYVAQVPLWLFLACFVLFFAKKMNLAAMDKDSPRTNAGFSLAVAPLCAAALGIAVLLPKPSAQLTLSFTARQAQEGAQTLLAELGPDMTLSYTEESGRLGGPISLNNRLVMEVDAPERLYLAGSVRDTYTGSAWTASHREKQRLEGVEGLYQASAYSPAEQSSQDYYMRFYGRTRQTVAVYMGDTRSRVLFVPPFLSGLQAPEEARVSMTPYGTLEVERALAKNAGYQGEYISWNYQNQYLIEAMRAMGGGLPGEEYIALPESLPDRVAELAGQLTAGAGNQYDKVQAIIAHLGQFPYTLSPDTVPAGQDFVDYFLFTGQEGYCVYYASSLAVMARSVGIPARYVEGFAMPAHKNDRGLYEVTNAQAHAWTEIYFEGLGWVPFEPTPAAGQPDGSGQAAFGEEEENLPEESSDEEQDVEELPPVEPDDSEDGNRQPENPDEPLPTEHETGRQEDTPAPVPEKASRKGGRAGWGVALLLLITAAGAGLLVWRDIRREKALAGLEPRAAVSAYFREILRTLALLGWPLEGEETAHAYAQRLDSLETGLPEGLVLEELAEIYARAAYSREPVGPHDRAKLKKAREALEEHRKAMGPVRYYWGRYLRVK